MNDDDVTSPWRKASYSNSQANCVEVARTRGGHVVVRDSKNTDDVALSFPPDGWLTFVAKVQTIVPLSLGAWAAAHAEGSLRCHHGKIAAAKRPKQEATARRNH